MRRHVRDWLSLWWLVVIRAQFSFSIIDTASASGLWNSEVMKLRIKSQNSVSVYCLVFRKV